MSQQAGEGPMFRFDPGIGVSVVPCLLRMKLDIGKALTPGQDARCTGM